MIYYGNRNLDLSRLGNTVSFLPALICLFSVLAVTIRDSLVPSPMNIGYSVIMQAKLPRGNFASANTAFAVPLTWRLRGNFWPSSIIFVAWLCGF